MRPSYIATIRSLTVSTSGISELTTTTAEVERFILPARALDLKLFHVFFEDAFLSRRINPSVIGEFIDIGQSGVVLAAHTQNQSLLFAAFRHQAYIGVEEVDMHVYAETDPATLRAGK